MKKCETIVKTILNSKEYCIRFFDEIKNETNLKKIELMTDVNPDVISGPAQTSPLTPNQTESSNLSYSFNQIPVVQNSYSANPVFLYQSGPMSQSRSLGFQQIPSLPLQYQTMQSPQSLPYIFIPVQSFEQQFGPIHIIPNINSVQMNVSNSSSGPPLSRPRRTQNRRGRDSQLRTETDVSESVYSAVQRGKKKTKNSERELSATCEIDVGKIISDSKSNDVEVVNNAVYTLFIKILYNLDYHFLIQLMNGRSDAIERQEIKSIYNKDYIKIYNVENSKESERDSNAMKALKKMVELMRNEGYEVKMNEEVKSWKEGLIVESISGKEYNVSKEKFVSDSVYFYRDIVMKMSSNKRNEILV